MTNTTKYAPTSFFAYVPRRGFCCFDVARYIVHAPGSHSNPIRSDFWALEMVSTTGERAWQGFEVAPRINSELRMTIDLTGREHDEVLKALPDCHVL